MMKLGRIFLVYFATLETIIVQYAHGVHYSFTPYHSWFCVATCRHLSPRVAKFSRDNKRQPHPTSSNLIEPHFVRKMVMLGSDTFLRYDRTSQPQNRMPIVL